MALLDTEELRCGNNAYFRTLVNHPVPWRYKAGVIYDAEDRIVVAEGSVSAGIVDLVWAIYFDILREENS